MPESEAWSGGWVPESEAWSGGRVPEREAWSGGWVPESEAKRAFTMRVCTTPTFDISGTRWTDDDRGTALGPAVTWVQFIVI